MDKEFIEQLIKGLQMTAEIIIPFFIGYLLGRKDGGYR